MSRNTATPNPPTPDAEAAEVLAAVRNINAFIVALATAEATPPDATPTAERVRTVRRP